MQERAPAKVNLYLRVLGKRPDGYHLLDSLAVFAGAADLVRAAPADTLSLQLEGRFGAGLEAETDNLVLRAARALAEAAGIASGVRLTLEKNLPIASGIGGGSADAAATLRLLSRFWGLSLPPGRVAGIAAGLGADVPVCVLSTASRMGGVGELLGVAPVLPGFGLVLVNPGVGVSTPAVFRARQAGFGALPVLPARWESAAAMAHDLALIGNDLQAPAIGLCPAIGGVLDWLRAQPGCLLAQMSGSGATCFGLFAEAEQARAVAGGAPSPWWSWGG